MELTINEACKAPQDFMYVWADEQKFLQYIEKKHAAVIRAKKANQIKLLNLSAEKYGKTYNDYTTEIRKAFIEIWGMTPAEALVILAQGGTVAGKNWEEGVYGVGAIYTNVFAGTNIEVRPEDGRFTRNGQLLPGNDDLDVYTTVNNKPIVYQRFYQDDANGVTYMSQYNKTRKKYYAASFSNADGTFSAKTGDSVNASDSADIWASIIQGFDKFVQWLISVFSSDPGKKLLSAENTLPNQQADGFVQKEPGGSGSGLLESGSGLILALATAGILLSGGIKTKK